MTILFIDAAKVIKAKSSKLEKFLLRTKIIPYCLIKEHIDALGNKIELLVELKTIASHNLYIYLIDKSGKLLKKGQSLG